MRLVVGQGDEAVAQVAGRRHAHVAAQSAGAAAVVGHRHDGRQVAGVRLEAAQEGGETVAAADRDHARPARELAGLADLRHGLRARLLEEPGAARADEGHQRAEHDAVDRQQGGGIVAPVQPAHAQALEQIWRPEHADREDRRRDQEGGAREGEQDPALDPEAGIQPLEGALH